MGFSFYFSREPFRATGLNRPGTFVFSGMVSSRCTSSCFQVFLLSVRGCQTKEPVCRREDLCAVTDDGYLCRSCVAEMRATLLDLCRRDACPPLLDLYRGDARRASLQVDATLRCNSNRTS